MSVAFAICYCHNSIAACVPFVQVYCTDDRKSRTWNDQQSEAITWQADSSKLVCRILQPSFTDSCELAFSCNSVPKCNGVTRHEGLVNVFEENEWGLCADIVLGSKLPTFPRVVVIASFILIGRDNVENDVMQDTCALLPDDVPWDAYHGSSDWIPGLLTLQFTPKYQKWDWTTCDQLVIDMIGRLRFICAACIYCYIHVTCGLLMLPYAYGGHFGKWPPRTGVPRHLRQTSRFWYLGPKTI